MDLLTHLYLDDTAVEIVKRKLVDPQCKRGVKAVQKTLLNTAGGVAILAEDITPFDTASHIPAMCKEKNVTLKYIRSRFDILTEKKNPVSCVFIPLSILSSEEQKKF